MTSHHPAIRARSLTNVLTDLRHARRDWEQALHDRSADAEDRATEAETRLEDLRDEFWLKFTEATGLTVEALMKAREDCLL
jgi:ribosome recycling factor